MIPLGLQAATRIGINIVLLCAGVVALKYGEAIFIPTIIALLLASILMPAAHWMHQSLRIRWSLACTTVIFLVLLVNLVVMALFSLSLSRILQQTNEEQIRSVYFRLRDQLSALSPWELDPRLFPDRLPQKAPAPQSTPGSNARSDAAPPDVGEADPHANEKMVGVYITQFAPRFAEGAAKLMANWIWQGVLILFLLLFLMLEGRMLARRVVEIFGPSQEVREQVGSVLRDMARHVRTYLVWRTIINFGLALVMGAIFQLAGLDQAWTWAILLAILNYIPYLGPLVAAVPPAIDALVSTTPLTAGVVMLLYLLVTVVEGYLIVPLLMGRNMDMNATTVIVACLFWDLVWGVPGLFLAMPIMAAIKAVLYHVPEWRPWANLMSLDDQHDDRPPVSPRPPAASASPAALLDPKPSIMEQSHMGP